MISILFQVFLISFLLNLLWEVIHSQLYTTCIKLPLKKFITLIIKASICDGLWITLFFLISVMIFKNVNILANPTQLFVFILLVLVFSYIDEKISLRMKRWKYSKKMVRVFGVGISPLLELIITGMLTLFYVFLI
jgi:hypothetical protein